MKTSKGLALFRAPVAGDAVPSGPRDAITPWAARCGFAGAPGPALEGRRFDLGRAFDDVAGAGRDKAADRRMPGR